MSRRRTARTTNSPKIIPRTARITDSEIISRMSVFQVRWILSSLGNGIPMELVLRIMGFAEYHPTLCTKRDENVDSEISAGGHLDTNACWAAKLYVVSKPLPRSPGDQFWKVKKVVWELEGHDQGWVTDPERPRGQYAQASSWYDACIFRPDPANGVNIVKLPEIDGIGHTFTDSKQGMLAVQQLLQASGWMMVSNGEDLTWRLQNNQIANGEFQRHVFEWSADEPFTPPEAIHTGSCDGKGFVEALRPGDRIGIWMRARLAGWRCCTKAASVSIMYEFR